ncbi:hypothetical protein PISMIDRAFT_20410 [Pisolithus microcarpus 441]|uniref:Uncharacterized protein n=1 Tax=Pisolithus microcarpus 441 TaxID=765257 RepID=A0A0C9YQV7_9AGAM|nr:hypothetical protein PISMIDRAFT_20410 [Pisolithus microcarpus 441]
MQGQERVQGGRERPRDNVHVRFGRPQLLGLWDVSGVQLQTHMSSDLCMPETTPLQ